MPTHEGSLMLLVFDQAGKLPCNIVVSCLWTEGVVACPQSAEGDHECEAEGTSLPHPPHPPTPLVPEGGPTHHNGLGDGEDTQALDTLIPETN
uniref:Uncharacterized protein n=1 Tax=Knipowitschia caucasica TaxID=637954 RepID=A0AAV2L588_KNICA